MDVYCPKCGEPWDFECFHEEAQELYGIPFYVEDCALASSFERRASRERNPDYSTEEYEKCFDQVRQSFRANGCSALTVNGARCSPAVNDERALVADVALELCGDDLDGAAAMMEDLAA